MGNRRALRKAAFAGYLLLLILLVAVKFDGSFQDLAERAETCRRNRELGYWNLNLVPFRSIRMQLRYLSHRWARINLLGNVVPFLPFGFLFSACTGSGGGRTLPAGLAMVLAIEVFQFVSCLGSFDVDDVLLNMLGIAAGQGILCLYRKQKEFRRNLTGRKADRA